jgi:hypothetical protein
MSDLPYDPQRDWFYRGREVGKRKERERIIKLLEEAECQGENDWCKTIEQAIVLIKGIKSE